MISVSFRNRHEEPGVKVNIRREKVRENSLEVLTNRNSKADSLNYSVSLQLEMSTRG